MRVHVHICVGPQSKKPCHRHHGSHSAVLWLIVASSPSDTVTPGLTFPRQSETNGRTSGGLKQPGAHAKMGAKGLATALSPAKGPRFQYYLARIQGAVSKLPASRPPKLTSQGIETKTSGYAVGARPPKMLGNRLSMCLCVEATDPPSSNGLSSMAPNLGNSSKSSKLRNAPESTVRPYPKM